MFICLTKTFMTFCFFFSLCLSSCPLLTSVSTLPFLYVLECLAVCPSFLSQPIPAQHDRGTMHGLHLQQLVSSECCTLSMQTVCVCVYVCINMVKWKCLTSVHTRTFQSRLLLYCAVYPIHTLRVDQCDQGGLAAVSSHQRQSPNQVRHVPQIQP